jgi:hypothetical protein
MDPDKVGATEGEQLSGATGPAPSTLAAPQMEAKVKQLLSAVKEVSPGAPAETNAGHLLTELAQCLNAVLSLVQTTIANLRPTSEHTLPAVASTLTAMVGATESVVHRVLDEADGLTALTRLSPFVNASNLDANAALLEAREASCAMTTRMAAITSAMEFQDLTEQHLNSAIKAIDGIQGRLLEILASLKIPLETSTLPPIRLEARIGSPAGSGPWRQAVADQHFAERK